MKRAIDLYEEAREIDRDSNHDSDGFMDRRAGLGLARLVNSETAAAIGLARELVQAVITT